MTLDLEPIFAFSVSPWEMIIRGSAMYWFLLVLFRVVVRRRVGAVGISDLLLLVIIADAAQNAMAGEYTSVTDGLLLVLTIIGSSYFLGWLGYHVPPVGRLVHPPPMPLTEDGKLLRQNLRRQFVTEEELMSHLREQGVEEVSQVKRAYIEGDGRISVVPREGQSHQGEQSGPV